MIREPAARFVWVEGSPSAAENPPHDRRWRAAIAEAVRRQPATAGVELDFLLEPGRVLIDLDNLVRLALDGLRDSGTLTQGMASLDTILATKRVATPLGLGVTLVRDPRQDGLRPLHERIELAVEAEVIPREGNFEEKLAWSELVRSAWSGEAGSGPIAVDIVAKTTRSLGALLKPVIDGLEAYLGRGTVGRGHFRPLDERVVVLRVRRTPDLPKALKVIAGPASRSIDLRVPPEAPALPEMDPGFTYSMSDLEGIDRHAAWRRIFMEPPRWRES